VQLTDAECGGYIGELVHGERNGTELISTTTKTNFMLFIAPLPPLPQVVITGRGTM